MGALRDNTSFALSYRFPLDRFDFVCSSERAGTTYSRSEKTENSLALGIATRSGTETAAILDVAERLDLIHEDDYQKGRKLLIRIIMMLTKLAQKSD